MKFRVSVTVVGSKYLGEFEAKTKEEAIEMASRNAYVSLCHQCGSECEDAQMEEFHAEADDDGGAK